ncbi:MATE family efflux transporter [Clostridium senegalense]|uniref:MATE family efflux transporter n=1 Tax=Clostridium senegalense TaxID=1465809 RepID=A0A6M0H4P8_9CLOT|nr:MATE family efflux transporter [Clostridium senegalense]NEU05224.1 MATE family efflux transporter [Clostridium senegalense]
MEERKLKEKLIKITWPIFIESILFSLLGGTDIFMLGRYSDNAVAAVGVANQLMFMVNLTFAIITAGTSILVSQYIGHNKEYKKGNENIIKVSIVSIVFNLIIGIIISILMVMGGTVLLKALNTADELLIYGNSYVSFVGGFVFIQALSMTFTAILRPHGLTKICMIVTFIMNIINITLNYILIFGNFNLPALGVKGAAISTTLSKIIGTIILGIVVYKKVLKDFKLSLFEKFPMEDFKNILIIGIPAAGEEISYSLSQLVVTGFINLISINSMATKSYIANIASFAYLFSASLAQGCSILVGQLVGEEETELAYKLCLKCLKKAMIVTTTVSFIFLLLGKHILGIFTSNEEIIALGFIVLFVDLILEPGRTINLVGITSLRATGDVKFPVCIGIFSMWIFGVGLAYILGIKLGFGLVGMWIAFAIDEWFRGILVYNRWKKRKWLGKSFVSKAKTVS